MGVGGGGVVGLAENKATQPSLAGAWAEHGNISHNIFAGPGLRAGALKNVVSQENTSYLPPPP